MSDTAKPGDRIRVTVEGTVAYGADDFIRFKEGYSVVTTHAEVTVLERADDPSKDPVGTLRGNDGWLLVRRETGGSRITPWMLISYPDRKVVIRFGWEHFQVEEYPVIGVVPWSPADKSSWM
jgi:hypothetical protein